MGAVALVAAVDPTHAHAPGDMVQREKLLVRDGQRTAQVGPEPE